MGLTSDIALGASRLRNKNYIINGDFGIAQRGESFIGVSGLYTLDRWYVIQNGTAGDVVQGVAPLPPGGESFIFFSGAGINGNLRQMIEGVHRFPVGRTFTLSFKCLSAVSFDMPWAVSFADTVSASDITIASGIVPNCGGQGVGSPNDWTTHSVTFTVNASPNPSNLGVIVSLVGDTSESFSVAQVQLEEGSVATDFEYRPIAEELALCQRYYCKSYDTGTAPGTITNVGVFDARVQLNTASVTNAYENIQFPVNMRTVPSMTAYSPATGDPGQFRDSQGAADILASFLYTGAGSVRVSSSPALTNRAIQSILGHWTADAEL